MSRIGYFSFLLLFISCSEFGEKMSPNKSILSTSDSCYFRLRAIAEKERGKQSRGEFSDGKRKMIQEGLFFLNETTRNDSFFFDLKLQSTKDAFEYLGFNSVLLVKKDSSYYSKQYLEPISCTTCLQIALDSTLSHFSISVSPDSVRHYKNFNMSMLLDAYTIEDWLMRGTPDRIEFQSRSIPKVRDILKWNEDLFQIKNEFIEDICDSIVPGADQKRMIKNITSLKLIFVYVREDPLLGLRSEG